MKMLLRNKRILIIFFWTGLVLVLTVPVVLMAFSSVPKKAPPLLIISFDGFRWDYLNRTSTPSFDFIINNGVYAERGLKNVFVTSTLTNHWSMVTGLYAESHGVIDNNFFDPEINRSNIPLYKNWSAQNDPRFYDTGATPIWVLLQQQKEQGRSGTIMWWGAENVVQHISPTYHMPYNLSIESSYKVDTMVNWFTGNLPINLGLLYFSEPDHTAHQFGPDSVNVTQRIKEADEITGYLLQKLSQKHLLNDINIIITSDHGFAPSSKETLINLDDYINPDWYTMIQYTPVAAMIPKKGFEDTIFNKLKAASENNHFTVYRKSDIPDRYHYRNNNRVTPIIVVADITYNFISKMPKEDFKLAGSHGYDNEYQDMHPFFMAMGPSFKKNYQVSTFHLVDLYPLMCHILQLQPAPNNGSMEVVSRLLQEYNQITTWTISTYALCLFVISIVGGLFAVTPFWYPCNVKSSFSKSAARSSKNLNKYSLIKDKSDMARLLEEADDEEL